MEKEANIKVITAGGPGSGKKNKKRRKPKKQDAPPFNATPQKTPFKDDPTASLTEGSSPTDSGTKTKTRKPPYRDNPKSQKSSKTKKVVPYKDVPEEKNDKSANADPIGAPIENKQTPLEPMALEFEQSQPHLEADEEDDFVNPSPTPLHNDDIYGKGVDPLLHTTITAAPSSGSGALEDLYQEPKKKGSSELFWLFTCFFGIMMSFVCYGLLLEYTTSGGRKLHELSFLFVTSALYTVTAAAGRYVRAETPSTIPPARFAVLGLTSMGSTFCSVRSLRYVIYPIQVLAKSCKPVPVMIMGAFMGKRYPLKKYVNVVMIVLGVALFMGGGDKKGGKKSGGGNDDSDSSPGQMFGILLLFISLCFDGGTGAYEDKLMSVHSVGPFDLMYNIQLGKTILAGVSLLVLNELHIFMKMCQEMGFLLVALGLSGALGQVFIFVTISKFGALTCSIIGLARKVTTLVASIYFYGHHLNGVQFSGLVISVASMVLNFWGKGGGKGGGGHGHGPPKEEPTPEQQEEMRSMLDNKDWVDEPEGDVELANSK